MHIADGCEDNAQVICVNVAKRHWLASLRMTPFGRPCILIQDQFNPNWAVMYVDHLRRSASASTDRPIGVVAPRYSRRARGTCGSRQDRGNGRSVLLRSPCRLRGWVRRLVGGRRTTGGLLVRRLPVCEVVPCRVGCRCRARRARCGPWVRRDGLRRRRGGWAGTESWTILAWSGVVMAGDSSDRLRSVQRSVRRCRRVELGWRGPLVPRRRIPVRVPRSPLLWLKVSATARHRGMRVSVRE